MSNFAPLFRVDVRAMRSLSPPYRIGAPPPRRVCNPPHTYISCALRMMLPRTWDWAEGLERRRPLPRRSRVDLLV